MPSVFERIVAFCEANHKCIVPQQKRNDIGKQVSSYWYGTFKNHESPPKKNQIEPEGCQFQVLDYPDWFTPKMDEIIENFYSSLKKNRERIPLKSTYKKVIHPALTKKIS